MKVSIIGGAGKFGRHLGEALEEKHDIIISDSDQEKAEEVAGERDWKLMENRPAASTGDIVIVSVPISATVEVIEHIGPAVSEDTLLCDVTSVKKKPCEAMEEYSDQVVGMHPMYAPSNSIGGQKVVLCPVEGKKWTVMEEFWKENGAEIHVTDPESHDRAMSVVQGLMHFSELVVAETIRKTEIDGSEMEKYSSPVYQLITDLTARMLNQQPELYGSIQAENPENEEIREKFIESAEEIRSLVGDEEFAEKFEELGEQFDLEGAQERTDSVIEFLSDSVR